MPFMAMNKVEPWQRHLSFLDEHKPDYHPELTLVLPDGQERLKTPLEVLRSLPHLADTEQVKALWTRGSE